ncbi:MAG: 4'-phosphopantetheinyl transferase superfamily protein [Nitrospirae bacterium]|nr:MAG: 4'-phosphopantetheinyl transferase superfamily protein [Nitrospirota bacterium]
MTLLHPVILPISLKDRHLKGREAVLAQRRRAREALALSCAASGIAMGVLNKDGVDAPLPFAGNYWSLSHKCRYVAAVVSSSPVGIDIEEIRPRADDLMAYIADEQEWALAARRDWKTFFRYWTAKEAVLKAVGIGLRHLKQARIDRIIDGDNLIVRYESRLWPIRHLNFQDHVVSLTHDIDVCWSLTTG